MKAKLSSEDFDRAFDAGEDITLHLDLDRATRPNLAARRVNVDFPTWMVEGLDARAAHLGITRQALVKVWIAKQLEPKNLRTAEFERGHPAAAVGSQADLHVGRRIKYRRWQTGITQQQLGEVIGVGYQQIQHYETGREPVSWATLVAISETLSVSIDFFVEGMGIELEGAELTGASQRGDDIESKEALELLRYYHAIPEAQRKRLFDLAKKLGEAG